MKQRIIFEEIIRTSIRVLKNELGIKRIPKIRYSRHTKLAGQLGVYESDEKLHGYYKISGFPIDTYCCPFEICISYRVHDKGNDIRDWGAFDVTDLVDTVAHEVAHLKEWSHNKAHQELTDHYRDIIFQHYNEYSDFTAVIPYNRAFTMLGYENMFLIVPKGHPQVNAG